MWSPARAFGLTAFIGLASCASPPSDTSSDPNPIGIAAASNPAGNLDQCANGPIGAPVACTGSAWQNGNLNDNGAHYLEGQSVPYRLRLSSLPLGTSHTVRIEWDTTLLQSGALDHALDYLTTYSRTETTADPCSGVTGCSLAANTTWQIPSDSYVQRGPDDSTGTADDITQVPGVFTLFGGTITAVSGYTLRGSYDGNSAMSVTITFTATSSNPVLAWGAHVSMRADWAPEFTASHFPGSPYHMRFLDLDGAGGNQDRSLSAAAIHEPPTLYVIKVVVNGYGGTAVPGDFTMTVTGNTPTPSSFAGTSSPGTMVEFGLSGGSYDVDETAVTGYEASYSTDCTGTLLLDQVKTCTVTNTQTDRCAGVVCDPAPNDCYEAGVCSATTGQCTYAPKGAGTACGDATDSVCDNPNTCDGAGVCQANHEPATTLCRADAGDCDVPEYCDGAGSCPADSFESAGTACGSPADSVCDNPDTCNASGVCQSNFEPTVVMCRADAGDCDVPEYCDGVGSCPANNFEPAGTACGSPADSVCDNPDSCNASGVCQSNVEPGTTLCRADAGECDVPEYCDAAGSCPADSFEPAGTACGNPADSVCDNPDTCSGSGACQTNVEPATTLCRSDQGECDVPEYCDAAGSCPADSFEPAGTACGNPADSVCDNPDTCTGAGACQPNFEPTTVLCREDAGECDVPEYCDAAGSCPANTFEPAGTACGNPADTICDNPDTCTGAGACQPNVEPATTLCRQDLGECDVPEYCDAAGSCPADSFEPAGTACGNAADSVCDNPDTCTGAGACQPNHEPVTTLCRADSGDCDVPEFCDAAGSCPANTFEPAGTACGNPADTVCDNPDTCTGAGVCQSNVEPTTTLCRQDLGECDVPEYCDAAGSCPADGFEAAGTACGSSGDTICDNPDTCTGAGTCQPNHEPTTTLCRQDLGECDVPEYCDAAGSCPANGFEAAGTTCGDPADTICDNPDSCGASGTCEPNHEPVTTLCREDTGECDVPEYCDAAGSCPSNGFEPAGTACGSPTDTACDNPDTCNASGACAPNYEAAGTLCRAVAGSCDVPETCDAVGSCAPDSFLPAGTQCRASADACDPEEVCSGGAATCPVDVAATCTVCGFKFYDANANATFDPDEDGIAGWKFQLNKTGGGAQYVYSTSGGDFEFPSVSEGDFKLCEMTSSTGSWFQTAPTTTDKCFSIHVPSDQASDCTLDFGNLCMGAGGGRTIGYWGNRNGYISFMDDDGGASALALLVGLNLRNADGTPFNPTSYAKYKTWLSKLSSVNMAYMLSAQLSAMALAVDKGWVVDPSVLIYAPGTTSANALGFASLDDVMLEANTELGLHGVTTAGSPYRTYQAALKTALEKAASNQNFVQPAACAISFARVMVNALSTAVTTEVPNVAP